jgi:hypothetical protein
MNYILSVEEKLGPLSFCRIWHDNSGEGKHRSWFLDQIEMSDLQTGERYDIFLLVKTICIVMKTHISLRVL